MTERTEVSEAGISNSIYVNLILVGHVSVERSIRVQLIKMLGYSFEYQLYIQYSLWLYLIEIKVNGDLTYRV